MPLNDNYLRIPRDATFPTLPLSESFTEYAHAYYLAVTYLWDSIPKRHGVVPHPDNLVFPILFLIHQYLELELKETLSLIYSIGRMTGSLTPSPEELKANKTKMRTHDLA